MSGASGVVFKVIFAVLAENSEYSTKSRTQNEL